MIHVPDVNGYLFHSVVRREAPGVGFELTSPFIVRTGDTLRGLPFDVPTSLMLAQEVTQ